MQYKFHLQENLSFRNFGVWLIINGLKKPLKERFFQGQEKVSVIDMSTYLNDRIILLVYYFNNLTAICISRYQKFQYSCEIV